MAARRHLVRVLGVRVDDGIYRPGSVCHKHTSPYALEGVFTWRQRDNIERHGDNRQLQLGRSCQEAQAEVRAAQDIEKAVEVNRYKYFYRYSKA